MDYELLQRYIEGRVTAKEAEQVVDWLDADEAHVKEFMALHKAFDISVMNQSAAQTLRKRVNQIKLRSIGVELVKIAAVILLVLGIQYGVQTVRTRSGRTTPVPNFICTCWATSRINVAG